MGLNNALKPCLRVVGPFCTALIFPGSVSTARS